jgi:hypothetical protein
MPAGASFKRSRQATVFIAVSSFMERDKYGDLFNDENRLKNQVFITFALMCHYWLYLGTIP